MSASPHRRRDARRHAVDVLCRLGADTVRAVRDWRPPEHPEADERPARAERARRVPEPTWGRTPTATMLRRTVQRRALFPLLTALGRPEVVGLHHLLGVRTPVILAPNHASHSDAPLVLSALPEEIRDRTLVPAAADYFFDRRWLSVAVTLSMNAVPFDRTNEIADSVRRCERFLRHGNSIVLFPEGSRSRDGRLRGFKAGVAHLAAQTGAPVIPVYVQGTHRLLPRGKALPRPSSVVVHFGAPLMATEDEGARRFNARLEAAVLALASEARNFAHRDTRPRQGSWRESWQRSQAQRPAPGETGAALVTGGDEASTGHGWIDTWRSTTPR